MNTEISLNETIKKIGSGLCDVLSYLYDTEDSQESKQEARGRGKESLSMLNDLLPITDKQQFQVPKEDGRYVDTSGDWWLDDRIREHKARRY